MMSGSGVCAWVANHTFDKLRVFSIMLFDCFTELQCRLGCGAAQATQFFCRIDSTT